MPRRAYNNGDWVVYSREFDRHDEDHLFDEDATERNFMRDLADSYEPDNVSATDAAEDI